MRVQLYEFHHQCDKNCSHKPSISQSSFSRFTSIEQGAMKLLPSLLLFVCMMAALDAVEENPSNSSEPT